MPSEVDGKGPPLAERALDSLRGRVAAFHSAVATAEEEVRSYVTHRRGPHSFEDEQALIELGPFAIGRIDPARFALLLRSPDVELTPEAIDVLQRADAIMSHFAASTSVHRVRVPEGGDLRDVVKTALADVGRLFGAARAVELARSGVFDPDEHGHLLGPLPFRFWNRAERQLAPPLVAEMRGDDCLPAGLGEFLDGAVAIVLVATGPTTPAPLARLVTPGTFVLQTADPNELERLDASAHPGIALLFDEERPGQAHFVHDPDAGDAPWERLSVSQLPDEPDVGRGRRTPVWLEELVHLRTMAAPPTALPVAPPIAAGGGEPAGVAATSADRLAAWLLTQTDLSGL